MPLVILISGSPDFRIRNVLNRIAPASTCPRSSEIAKSPGFLLQECGLRLLGHNTSLHLSCIRHIRRSSRTGSLIGTCHAPRPLSHEKRQRICGQEEDAGRGGLPAGSRASPSPTAPPIPPQPPDLPLMTRRPRRSRPNDHQLAIPATGLPGVRRAGEQLHPPPFSGTSAGYDGQVGRRRAELCVSSLRWNRSQQICGDFVSFGQTTMSITEHYHHTCDANVSDFFLLKTKP